MKKSKDYLFDPRGSEIQIFPEEEETPTHKRASNETRISQMESLENPAFEEITVHSQSFIPVEESTSLRLDSLVFMKAPVSQSLQLASHRHDSIAESRRGEALKNIIDQLGIRKEKHQNVLKYYSSLETQLNENFRLAVVELYSKRNEVLAYLDSLLDNTVEKLKNQQSQLFAKLRKVQKDSENSIEDLQHLLDSVKEKVDAQDFEEFSQIMANCKNIVLKDDPKPDASFEDVKLDLTGFSFDLAANCPQNSNASTQTYGESPKKKHNHSRVLSLGSKDSNSYRKKLYDITFSPIYKNDDDVRIPFLGMNKLKVYLPRSYRRFIVVSISANTTASDVISALREHLEEDLKGAYLLLRSSKYEGDIVLKDDEQPSNIISWNKIDSPIIFLVKK